MLSIKYFKALADSTRIRLFNILIHHELNVNEVVELMEMGQSRISRHLKILTDAELLECRRDGVWAFYSVNKESSVQTFSNAIKYLFNQENILNEDLDKAIQIIENRKRRTNTFFNKIATEWDSLKTEILQKFELNSTILRLIKKGMIVADLGCGTGDLLLDLSAHSQKVIGVDSSSKMLEQAKKRLSHKNNDIDLRLGELEHLPIGNNEVDVAILSLVLHHLTDPAQAVSESSRILKTGGKLVIADFEKHTNERLRQTYGDRWLGFSVAEIEDWLTHCDFEVGSIKSYALNKTIKLNVFSSIKK